MSSRDIPIEATSATRTPKRKSPADHARDLRRAARHNADRQADVRQERVQTSARSEDVNPFMASSLDRRQRALDAEKLGLRRDVRDGLGTSENESFRGRS